MVETLQKKQTGMGGLFFILIAILCSLILIFTLRLNWASTAQASANNLSFMTSMTCSVYNFNTHSPSYVKAGNPAVLTSRDTHSSMTPYMPLEAFNGYLEEMNITLNGNGPTNCEVRWDATTNTTTLQFSPIHTFWGVTIATDPQYTVVE